MHVSVVYLKQIVMFMNVFEHKMSAALYLVVSKHIFNNYTMIHRSLFCNLLRFLYLCYSFVHIVEK